MAKFDLSITKMELQRVPPSRTNSKGFKLLRILAQNLTFANLGHAKKLDLAHKLALEKPDALEVGLEPYYFDGIYVLGNQNNLDWITGQLKDYSPTNAINWRLSRFKQSLSEKKIGLHSIGAIAASQSINMSGEITCTFDLYGGPPQSGIYIQNALWHGENLVTACRQIRYEKNVAITEDLISAEELRRLQEEALKYMVQLITPPAPNQSKPAAVHKVKPKHVIPAKQVLEKIGYQMPPKQEMTLNDMVNAFVRESGY